LLEAQVVLANGTTVIASASNQHSDLFWALRGAGQANLGVVTRYRYRLYRAQPRVVQVTASGILPDEAVRLLLLASDDASGAEPRFPQDCHLELLSDPEEGLSIFAACIGATGRDLDDLRRDASAFFRDALPRKVTKKMEVVEASWVNMAKEEAEEFSGLMVQFWDGFLFPGDNNREAWSRLMDTLSRLSRGNPHVLVDIELRGGAISQVGASATAFPWRDAVYVVGIGVLVPTPGKDAEAVFKEEGKRIGAAWDAEIAPYLHGTFANYAMSSLRAAPVEEAARIAWGDNLPRLEAVKARYDPSNVFRSALRIPVGTARASDETAPAETAPPTEAPSSLKEDAPTASPSVLGSTPPTFVGDISSAPLTEEPTTVGEPPTSSDEEGDYFESSFPTTAGSGSASPLLLSSSAPSDSPLPPAEDPLPRAAD
jgi:FAD/FMN-containing dehydrogenase